MARFVLDKDTLDLVLGFAWDGMDSKQLTEDLAMFADWHRIVPPEFLHAEITVNGECFNKVANPFRRGYPFTPLRLLSITPSSVWNHNLWILGAGLCKERVRFIRTYKKCAQRWIAECICNLHPQYYVILYKKLLHKLTVDLFVPDVSDRRIAFLLAAVHA